MVNGRHFEHPTCGRRCEKAALCCVQVYQGEDDWSVNNILVGEFVIDGIQRAKAGVAKFVVKV